ncbi:MAG: bifunctional acetate--CoA ligase family protein/GNAT family N-acetyltransferase [Devosia sp.]
MTTHNLDVTLTPRSVAVVGASTRAGSVGQVLMANIRTGGFRGAVYPVNPKYRNVEGWPCFASVSDLPHVPDLAIIATPARTVPDLVAQLGEIGTRAAVVITAGITGALKAEMLEAAGASGIRIIGPNTIGLIAPRALLNASFTLTGAQSGGLGIISQSGAIVSSILDWAADEKLGFSQVYSLGDMADVDVGDALNVLAADEHTRAILMYLESIPAPRKFMSAARAAARIKPVIAVKPGRHAEAAKAALTHTGALAGADRIVDAALRRAGIIRVNDLADLFRAAEVTGRNAPLATGRLAIVTNGGGAGVLAVDHLLDQGGTLATLEPATIMALDAVLPSTWSRSNPIDIIGDAGPERYAGALKIVAAAEGVDAVLVMNCPTALADPMAAARGVAALAAEGRIAGKPLLACWLGKHAAEPARQVLQAAGVATFESPSDAAAAVTLLTGWSSLRQRLERVPMTSPSFAVDRDTVEIVLRAAAGEGRPALTELEAKRVIAAYGVSVPPIEAARTAEEVEIAAASLLASSPAVVVKMMSRTVTHKSDVGGVVLNIETPRAAREAARAIAERFAARYPGQALDGFTVQPMVRRPMAEELLCGVANDPIFGPVVLFGAGGVAVEVLDDSAAGLVPLDDVLAGDLVDATRVGKLLAGYRDRRPADRQAIVRALLALSQLAIDFPAIQSIDINPLLADADGAVALDARIEIDPAAIEQKRPNPRLAIHPYPDGWQTAGSIGELDLWLRPIRPADARLYPAFLERVDPEDMRMRFLVTMKTLSQNDRVRLTQLDYDRDMAFVAIERETGEMAGVVRYASDPDHFSGEYGVLVRTDLKRRGLGRLLMQTLIDYARADGIEQLDGIVHAQNKSMLSLCRALGFSFSAEGESALRATLRLN